MHARLVTVALMALLCATAAVTAGERSPDGVVNINTASLEQLQLLPRVGPALAGRIVEFRETSGPFQSVDEIVAVKGIGEAALERLKPYITTSGATTLADKVSSPRRAAGSGAGD